MGKIVVGVDGSDASRAALRWAIEEARLRHADVVAVHTWVMPTFPAEIGYVPQVDFTEMLPGLEQSAQRLVEGVVAEVGGDDPGVEVRAVAAEGTPAAVLLEEAADAELLVVGSRGRGGLTGLLLGSVSQRLAQHAPCPLLIHRGPSS